MSMKDFSQIGKIGDGAYSTVFKVKRISDGQEYALKKVKMGSLSEKEKQNALNEVRILASINNPNIVAYKEAFFEDASSSLCLVMEFANDGDLYQKILHHQKKGTLMDENIIWTVLIHMVKALKVLHAMKIFHRDLKSANVFLCKDGNAKLGDLNVSKVAKKGMLYTQTGTPYYASPEVWKDQPYDHKSDIWSLGCVLYEMTTLKPPFRANDMNGLYSRVLKGVYPKISSQYTQDLNTVIKSLLQVQASMRPTCDQILAMDIVKKRMHLLKNHPSLIDLDNNLESINLLNTIKVPKNLAQLTKNLPKSNYVSSRENKFIQSHPQQRLQSEPPGTGGRILPSINSMKEIKIGGDSITQVLTRNKESYHDRSDVPSQKHKQVAQSVDDYTGVEIKSRKSNKKKKLDVITENAEDRFKRVGGGTTPASRDKVQRNPQQSIGGQEQQRINHQSLVEQNLSKPSKMKEDFLADLRLPGIQQNIGMLPQNNKGIKVIEKQRAQQQEMERKIQQQKKALEQIYLGSGKNNYEGQGNNQSLPPPLDRNNTGSQHSRILAAKLRGNYERVNPNSYGYNNNIQSSETPRVKQKQSQEYKIQPPIISTHNERLSSVSSKPSWWG